MSEKSLVPKMTTEIMFNFDKQDLVSIAIANGEKQMRQKIKDIKHQINELDNTEQIKLDMLIKNGEDTAAKNFEKISMKIEGGISAMGLNDLEMEIHCDVNYPKDYMSTKDLQNLPNKKVSKQIITNTYKIELARKKDPDFKLKTSSSFTLLFESMDGTKVQYKIMNELAELVKKRKELFNTGVEWRKKLNDIPAFERQMKAAVAKSEMTKTAEGRALLESMMTDIDSVIEMLGM